MCVWVIKNQHQASIVELLLGAMPNPRTINFPLMQHDERYSDWNWLVLPENGEWKVENRAGIVRGPRTLA